MKVSFVVPIYKKTPAQVTRCLSSLVQQSHRDLEIIPVFDGPDPALQEAVNAVPLVKEGFEGAVPCRVIVRPERGGAPAARNTGLDAATGDVVSFWDADCYAEPEMAARWVAEFEKRPDVDFVYSGYAWTDPGIPGFTSEMFDPWALEQYNYIATMFPIRRAVCPRWDESLEGLQDWDFWRRVAQAGHKGVFIPGFAFTTEFPDKESISGQIEKNQDRVKRVRAKHGDPARDVVVCGGVYKFLAMGLAKVLNADYVSNPFYLVREYKVAISLGYHPNETMQNSTVLYGAGATAKRVIYWTGQDADMFHNAPFAFVREMVRRWQADRFVHWVQDKRTRLALEDCGLEVAQVPFPHFDGVPLQSLPARFRVLVETDETYAPLAEAVVQAMPDIETEMVVPDKFYDVGQYSVCLQLTVGERLGEGPKNFLRQARHVISNVESPFAGFVNCADPAVAKPKIVRKIRAIKDKNRPNMEGQKYYLDLSNPARIREEVDMLKTVRPPVVMHVS
jgi:glycosyltransferase involved in cell wall biosynthesis